MRRRSGDAEMFTSWSGRLAGVVGGGLAAIWTFAIVRAIAGQAGATMVAVLVFAVYSMRSLQLGVTIDPSGCTIRNWHRTHHVPLSECERFTFRAIWYARGHQDAPALDRYDGSSIAVTVLTQSAYLTAYSAHRLDEMNSALARCRRASDQLA